MHCNNQIILSQCRVHSATTPRFILYVVVCFCVSVCVCVFVNRLKPFTSYKFRMLATNDIGDSLLSKETEAVTTLQDGERLGGWWSGGGGNT